MQFELKMEYFKFYSVLESCRKRCRKDSMGTISDGQATSIC